MSHAARRAISWTEQGLVPDVVIRSAIRRLLKQRLNVSIDITIYLFPLAIRGEYSALP